jgi:hypothetical protein
MGETLAIYIKKKKVGKKIMVRKLDIQTSNFRTNKKNPNTRKPRLQFEMPILGLNFTPGFEPVKNLSSIGITFFFFFLKCQM